MYDNQFVICVLRNGKPVREIGNKVCLSFNSEYKVRLKNKSFMRAKARVWIDGRQVSNLGDFILQPSQTLDLERFLDESMTSGRKFKFVPLGDGRVNDPTDPENGIIKVEFYKEALSFKIDWNPLINPIKPYRKGPYPAGTGSSFGRLERDGLTSTGPVYDSYSSNVSCNYVSNSISSSTQPGATVEGGRSGQSFQIGDDFLTEFYPVTLTLRIRGIDRREVDWEDNPKPIRSKKRIKFCPNCGAKRHGMSKFCQSCGTAYHPRYERERGRIVR